MLHQVSLYYGGSSTALGYVSFAGTVVSILLGLIAIIYSFVQSISHANSVSEIKSQVKRLVKAGDGIVKLEKSLEASADKISNLTDDYIVSINENTQASREVVKNIESGFRAGAVMGGEDSSANHLITGYTWLNIGGAIIWWVVENNKAVVDFEVEYGELLAKELGVEFEFISGVMVAMGTMMAEKDFLEIINIDSGVSFNKKKGFDEYLGPAVEATKESEDEQYVKLWRILNR